MSLRGFASDNNSGVHPEVLQSIARANEGHVLAYGDDPWTEGLRERFRAQFGASTEAFPVFNGTAANVLCLGLRLRPHQAVICAETAHVHVDECGAPERHLGVKLLPLATPDGKLTPELVAGRISQGVGDQHHVQPGAITITQSTELGTVYRPEEIRALAELAHAHGLLLHMDGARLGNAAASLEVSLREISSDCGVDALSFGGTKNGLLGAEAAVFFGPSAIEAAARFKYLRKQGMQLASKMRFVSAQLSALLTDELWLRSARQANAMARRLAEGAAAVAGVRIARPVEANAVFAILPRTVATALKGEWPFYVWGARDPGLDEVRWVASFDTTEEDVRGFLARLGALMAEERARSC